jgi:PAS domain S-box-containing protein
MLRLPRLERSRTELWKQLIDAAIVLMGLSLLVWFFVVRILVPGFTEPLKLAQTLGYPAGDMLVIGVAATVWSRRPATLQRALGLLLGGIALNSAGDLCYQVVYFRSGALVSDWSDGIFICGYVLLLWAAELYLRRPALSAPAAPGPGRLHHPSQLPLVAAGAAGLLLFVVAIQDWSGALSVLAIGMIMLMVLLALRESLTVRENLRFLTEQVARKSEARYEALVRHGSDLVMVVDAQSLVRFASASVRRVLGRAPEELIGQPFAGLLVSEDQAQAEHFINDALLRSDGSATAQWRMRHASGQPRSLETIVTNLLAEPSVSGLVLNARDVTERDLLEEQLRQAQKMEAIGRLAGGVAHDFNNLLTTVLASSDLALTQVPPSHPARGDLEEIQHAAERAAALTGQLLAFSRKQVVEPRVLDLGKVVQDTVRMLERLVGERVRVVPLLAPDLGPVRADRAQLEQVLLNLAVNARDAMPNGGVLTIEAENVEFAAPRHTPFMELPAGRYVLLAVADTGHGMDDETLRRVFEPFFTTKDRGKGTGLGLASVYGIVRQSGGSITVESGEGEGARFVIYLPRASGPVPQAEEPAGGIAPAGSGTILLAEDEAALLSVAQRILQNIGYTVLTAPSAEEALDVAGRHPGKIDLLLTDVIMPGESGPTLAARLARQRPGLRVLFMSGYAGDELGVHGVLDPSVELLQKPFTAQELATRVRDAMTSPATPAPG